MSQIVHRLSDGTLDEATLAAALGLRGDDQAALFELARRRRRERFPGDPAEVRSVVEVSNVCHQKCNYCSIGSATRDAEYVIGQGDFLEIVGHVQARGRRCLLVQSGENRAPEFVDAVCACVAETRRRFPEVTVILCLGNLSRAQYAALRAAGGDRYILKFETSSPELYRRSKPNDTLEQRLECLHHLEELGFGVGTGNIVGLPGQTPADLVADLRLLGTMSLTMMSCSAFIPGEQTPYRDNPPGDLETTLNYMALMRVLYPDVLIPTTSSLEKVGAHGQYRGLLAGANAVTIHDGTPARLREHFPIYSANRFVPDEAHIMGIVQRAGLKV